MAKHTIRDVAKLAGVSISTVSRILNNHERVRNISESIRSHVLSCARELDYVPNANARRVFAHRSWIVGLLIPSYHQMRKHIFEDGHLCRLLSGLEDGLSMGPYRLLLLFNDERFRTQREYVSLLQSQTIDGLLVWGAQPSESYWLETLGQPLPLLFLVTVPGTLEQGWRYIVNDTQASTRAAFESLLAKGHRRLLYLHVTSAAVVFIEQQMMAVLPELRREHPEAVIEEQTAREDSSQPLDMEIFGTPEAPTAIVTYNHNLADLVIRQLQAEGLRVPQDVEVLSGYSYSKGSLCLPRVVVDDFAIGRQAAQDIQQLIDQPELMVQRRYPATLKPRETV